MKSPKLLEMLAVSILGATSLPLAASDIQSPADILFETIEKRCISSIVEQSEIDNSGLLQVPALRKLEIFQYMANIIDPTSVELWQTASPDVVIVDGGLNGLCSVFGFEISEEDMLSAYRRWRQQSKDGLFVRSDIEAQSTFQKKYRRRLGVLVDKMESGRILEVHISSYHRVDQRITILAFVAGHASNPWTDPVFREPAGDD